MNLNDKIDAFICTNIYADGCGHGDRCGRGYGCGYGGGYGDSYGDGSGSGNGAEHNDILGDVYTYGHGDKNGRGCGYVSSLAKLKHIEL